MFCHYRLQRIELKYTYLRHLKTNENKCKQTEYNIFHFLWHIIEGFIYHLVHFFNSTTQTYVLYEIRIRCTHTQVSKQKNSMFMQVIRFLTVIVFRPTFSKFRYQVIGIKHSRNTNAKTWWSGTCLRHLCPAP